VVASAKLLEGDNLPLLGMLEPGSVTLAYLDPPFFTQRDFGAFDDRWESLDAYLAALRSRVLAVKPLLTNHGSIVVHVDPKAGHYVKVMLDGVFGRDAFIDEIIWRYRRWPVHGRRFQRMHDVLFRYALDPKACRWNQLYEPLAPSTVRAWGEGKQKAVFREGKRVRSSTAEEASPGVPMSDVWEISIIAPGAKERNGYPTQKPEALLRRLVEALTDPGDIVLDPYMGSATLGAVALAEGREYIGIDSSPEAHRIARERLAAYVEENA
jgi:DNA modification methylase